LRYITVLVLLVMALHAVTAEQLKVLQTVRDVARSIPDHRGVTYEDTLSAICITESSAGVNLIGDFKKEVQITKASLGVLQIQVATAHYIAERVPALAWVNGLGDAEIANRLLSDVTLSARIAAHYLALLRKQRGTYLTMISGYNGGMTNRPYYRRVMKNIGLVKELVKSGHLN